MRDEGLKLAIEAAGGVAALARGLGIKQPSVSTWTRVPVERIAAIEEMTGVGRERLRPDLYANTGSAEPVDEIEAARSMHYLLLGKLLRSAPSSALLDDLRQLSGDGSALGMAVIELAEAAVRADETSVAEEFFALFIGIGRGEVLPYASFYLTGFLHERPLARVREDLAKLGIERADGNFDPEDHLGILLEIMGGLASGTFAADIATQRAFFKRHVEPWGARCFADIGVSPAARFYKAVAQVGREFLAIESDAFEFED